METPEASDLKAYPTCRICDRGTLTPRKIRRLSGPAVAIGYILLIPSILGVAGCAILLVVSLLAGVAGAAHGSAIATAFAGIGTIAFVYIGICCFVFGLLGWLLIMKKHVLQCVYCGTVVDAAAAVHSHPNRSFGRASVFGFFFLFLIFIAMAAGVFHNDYKVWAEGGRSYFDWTEFAARWHIHMATEPAQPAPDNSTAEPTQPDTWQPFTSADGRFSVMFPSPPQQSKMPPESHVHGFSSSADKGHTVYMVEYTDLRPDFGPEAVPQAMLGLEEKIDIGDGLLINDKIIDLHGVPGRAFETADPSGDSEFVREFFTWPYSYKVTAIAAKGYAATQADQFMNSFKIWGNPPTAVDNSTAPSETPKPTSWLAQMAGDTPAQETQKDTSNAPTPQESQNDKQGDLGWTAMKIAVNATPTAFNEQENLRFDSVIVMPDDTVCLSVHDANPRAAEIGLVEPSALIYLPRRGSGTLFAVTDMTVSIWTRGCIDQQGGVDVLPDIEAHINKFQQRMNDLEQQSKSSQQ